MNAPAWMGRWAVLLAALLWSTSGAFVKGLALSEVTITVYRAGFAGCFLLAVVLLTRRRMTFDFRMCLMAVSFTLMNYWFMASMTRTTAANALFLQYTAPLWMSLAGVFFLGEKINRRTSFSIAVGMLGIGILIMGTRTESAFLDSGVIFGLLSGLGYASVAVFLRALRHHDPVWLAAINQLSAGVVAACYFASDPATRPDVIPPQSATLFILVLFGIFQLALPYVIFAWGLRSVSAQEAGVLTLLEPTLNPIWTYLVAGERPSPSTILGGLILIFALCSQVVRARKANSMKDAGDGRP